MDPDANEPNFDPEANDHRKSSDHAEDDKSHSHTGDGASPGYFTFFPEYLFNALANFSLLWTPAS